MIGVLDLRWKVAPEVERNPTTGRPGEIPMIRSMMIVATMLPMLLAGCGETFKDEAEERADLSALSNPSSGVAPASPASPAATCVGNHPCKACRNCSRCRYCHGMGGYCGVCSKPIPEVVGSS